MTIAEKLTAVAENVPKVYEKATERERNRHYEEVSLEELQKQGYLTFVYGHDDTSIGHDTANLGYEIIASRSCEIVIKLQGYVKYSVVGVTGSFCSISFDGVNVYEYDKDNGITPKTNSSFEGYVNNEIRIKLSTCSIMFDTIMATRRYSDGYADGQKSEYDRFWDAFQENGEKKDYRYAFAYDVWNDETYNPKYPIRQNGYTSYTASLFNYNTNITDTKVDIELLNTSPTNVSVFAGATNLVTIRKLILGGNASFNGWFINAHALTNITIEGTIDKTISFQWCKKLSTASLQSIINALGGTESVTLTLPSKFNTDEYANIIAGKPSNWTISWL